jgi:2-polyprenyl-3-methyl-5-hydroxy-6-metoxy-1,4-benzoquinol methylase
MIPCCRLCGDDRLKLHYTQGNNGEFKFYRCSACGLVNYDLSTGLDTQKYAASFIDPHDEQIIANRAQTKTYQFIKKHITTRGTLLDIGCGNGRLLYLAHNDGWKVHGLELSPFLARSIEKKLGITVHPVDFLDYHTDRQEEYDAIVLRHVLEHLPDPVLAFQKINSLLKLNGHGVLEFPNIAAWDLRTKRFLQRIGLHKKRYRNDYRPGHCNEFARGSFSHLAKKTGFKIILWETYSHRPLPNTLFKHLHIGNKARVIIKKYAAAGFSGRTM